MKTVKGTKDNDSNHTYKFHINNSLQNKKEYKFKDNQIDTTKYNIFTFIPKALFYQFLRLANCYFLIIAIIQCIPAISPYDWESAVFPFLFVLCISLIREGVEDCQRYSLDKQQNHEEVEVYRNSQWFKTQSGKLLMGEIVYVKQDDVLPADLVMIDSSLSDGVCYIETGSLDGEKTLKQKQSPDFTKGKFISNNVSNIKGDAAVNLVTLEGGHLNTLNNEKDTHPLNNSRIEQFTIEGNGICDYPNPSLYQLNGRMTLTLNKETKEIPLDAKQLLLKGARLRNTAWCIGIVIYTGHNCKIMKNAKSPVVKYSRVETLMSFLLIMILSFQCLLSIIAAIVHGYYYTKNVERNVYITYNDYPYALDCFFAFFTYLLLLNTMIPISLIVTLEIVKIVQGLFIHFDAEGYSKGRKKLIMPNSVCLNEELGMVNYIFSDKTGTLTCNKMVFKFCVINDVCYEYIRNDYESNKDLRLKKDIIPFYQYDMYSKAIGRRTNETKGNDEAATATVGLGKTDPMIEDFWKALALCHDCDIQNDEYVGMSPDSIELVKTAKSQGFMWNKSDNNTLCLIKMGDGTNNQSILFEKLHFIEFSSDRKRESIIVKDNYQIKLYIKGADSIIEDRLGPSTSQAVLDCSKHYVNYFSSQGYRTLFIAMRLLTQEDYNHFLKEYSAAMLDTNNRDTKLSEAFSLVERNLTLLGATIVEDKLQDQVPETIKELRQAGIKIWMLTGDKMNTAYNIALSCNLISQGLKVFFVEGKDIKKDESLNIVNQAEREEVILQFAKEFNQYKGNYNSLAKIKFGLLVDEKALLTISESDEIARIFLEIASDAIAVICCRVSPLQKSQVVKMVKNYDKHAITLSIGDGGNDVSMIMEAHIGIGLYGEEGMRAAQSSDFAIGEFRILRQVLLYHGRFILNRNSNLVLYFFYKNFVFTIIHFYFGFYNNFSGQTIIDDWFITLFNLLFTSIPLGVRAVLDLDFLPEDGKIVTQIQPYLYAEERDKLTFTKTTFFFYLLRGTIHAAINFFWCIYSIGSHQLNSSGDYSDLWVNSVNMFTNIILIVTVHLVINTKYHTWINWFIILLITFTALSIFFAIANFMLMFNSVATMGISFGSSVFWLNTIYVVGTCMAMDMAIVFAETMFSKNLNKIMMILKKKEKFDKIPRCIAEKLMMNEKCINDNHNNKSDKEEVRLYSERNEGVNGQVVRS